MASSSTDSEVSLVTVRLGGFHLLTSFMGDIGYIMDGSGLQDLFSGAYSCGVIASTKKMLTGHAYSRALRAHILVHLALAKIVLSTIIFSEKEHSEINDILSDVGSTNFSENIEASSVISSIINIFSKILRELETTAKLWIQYFHMITLVKQFIQAERSGNWHLHLQCVQEMLPYFHASGHFLYAKSCHLYL